MSQLALTCHILHLVTSFPSMKFVWFYLYYEQSFDVFIIYYLILINHLFEFILFKLLIVNLLIKINKETPQSKKMKNCQANDNQTKQNKNNQTKEHSETEHACNM